VYHNNRYVSAAFHRFIFREKVMTELTLWMPLKKVLDNGLLHTDLGGDPGDLSAARNTAFAFGLALIYLILAAEALSTHLLLS
jgi:hypothetical protein